MNCEKCNEEHEGTYGSGRFCSLECARSFSTSEKREERNRKISKTLTRHGRYSRLVREKKCLNCHADLTNRNVKFCSHKCSCEYKTKQKIILFEKGEYKACIGCNQTIKKILIKKYGHVCQTCGRKKWNNKTIALEIHHKDGRSENCSPDNIQLICPNCHAQTDNYMAKNKGNGNLIRRMRYKKKEELGDVAQLAS